jgi:hypothetical protein
MIDRKDPLPVTTQRRILDLSRSGVYYYAPAPVSPADRELMRTIDEIHLDMPHLGSRGIRSYPYLLQEGALSWRLSNTLDNSFCIDALEKAMVLYGKPDIFNTDRGSQFTSDGFKGSAWTVEGAGGTISS